MEVERVKEFRVLMTLYPLLDTKAPLVGSEWLCPKKGRGRGLQVELKGRLSGVPYSHFGLPREPLFYNMGDAD